MIKRSRMDAIPHLEAIRLTWTNCSGVGEGGIKIYLAISPTKPIKTGPRTAANLPSILPLYCIFASKQVSFRPKGEIFFFVSKSKISPRFTRRNDMICKLAKWRDCRLANYSRFAFPPLALPRPACYERVRY